MDSEAARLILECYRPGTADAGDPMFAEALRAAEADPELARWFAEQQKFDSLMVETLARLPSPPVPQSFSFNQTERPAWLRFAPLALSMAALVVLSLFMLRFWSPRSPEERLALQAIDYTEAMPRLEFVCFDAESVAGWVAKIPAAQQAGLTYVHGTKAMDMRLIGAGITEWNGKPVVKFCLQNGQQTAMLYLIRGDDFSLETKSSKIVEKNGWVSKTARVGNRSYVLTTHGSRRNLNFEIPFDVNSQP